MRESTFFACGGTALSFSLIRISLVPENIVHMPPAFPRDTERASVQPWRGVRFLGSFTVLRASVHPHLFPRTLKSKFQKSRNYILGIQNSLDRTDCRLATGKGCTFTYKNILRNLKTSDVEHCLNLNWTTGCQISWVISWQISWRRKDVCHELPAYGNLEINLTLMEILFVKESSASFFALLFVFLRLTLHWHQRKHDANHHWYLIGDCWPNISSVPSVVWCPF